MIKNFLKKILKYVIIYMGLTIIFFLLMEGAYALPNDRIRNHVVESVPILKEEVNNTFFRTEASNLDLFTDSIILNVAMNKREKDDNFKNAMENSFYINQEGVGISSLEELTQEDVKGNYDYSRYWHGVQTIIRPLLLFFNYTEIRYLFMFIVIALLGVTFSMIGDQLNIKNSIAFAIALCFIYVILIPVSLQYSPIFIVTLVGMISVLALYKYNKEKYIPELFFIIGALATFFDLLTYPLISLGLPIIIALILENKKSMSLKNQVLFIIKLGLLWVIGYSLLFFTKWILASLILHKNMITVALNQILFRINGSEEFPVTRIGTIKNNIELFYNPIARYILLLCTIAWIILCVFYRKKISNCKIIIPLICIAIVPYIWYAAFANHSSLHVWYTNKIQVMSLFAILSIYTETIDFKSRQLSTKSDEKLNKNKKYKNNNYKKI